MMGAQRLDLSAGLAVPKSPIQDGVANGLGWAGGDIGLVGDTPVDEEGRRLAEVRPKALTGLYSKLTSLGIAMGVCTLAQLLVHYYWKHRANRGYYLNRKMSKTTKKLLLNVVNKEYKFTKFPIAFVFPSLFLIVFKLFCTGLIKNSMSLLVTPKCDSACTTLASFVLALCGAFVALGWAVVIQLNVKYRKGLWKPAANPPSARKIDDPFYRGISMLRGMVFGMEDPRAILNRSQGKYGKLPEHTKGKRSPNSPPYLSSAALHPLLQCCLLLSPRCWISQRRVPLTRLTRLTACVRAETHGEDPRAPNEPLEVEWN